MKDCTGVIYKINCNTQGCQIWYIGETKSALKKRIREHHNKNNKDSVVAQHMTSLKHHFDWSNVKIIDRESNYYKRKISEMIYIKNTKNNINRTDDTKNLSRIYNSVIKIL